MITQNVGGDGVWRGSHNRPTLVPTTTIQYNLHKCYTRHPKQLLITYYVNPWHPQMGPSLRKDAKVIIYMKFRGILRWGRESLIGKVVKCTNLT